MQSNSIEESTTPLINNEVSTNSYELTTLAGNLANNCQLNAHRNNKLASLLSPLFIGSVKVDPCTILAPMEGLTDAPFRSFIRSIGGCGLVVTEFVNASALSRRIKRAETLAQIQYDKSPVSIQIYGRDPVALAESAKICEDAGADIVDINMGCPSKAVTRHCAGVALMKEPTLVQKILTGVRKAITIPLTVKMRLGWDEKSINAIHIAHICQEEGVNAITVHGRTKADAFSGKANWQKIGEVKNSIKIPLIGNGDIYSVSDAKAILDIANVDGIMVGRGVLRNPWLLLQISQLINNTSIYIPTIENRRKMLLRYYDMIKEQIPHEKGALGKMKKVSGYFATGFEESQALRKALWHSKTTDEVISRANYFFDNAEYLSKTNGIDIFSFGIQ